MFKMSKAVKRLPASNSTERSKIKNETVDRSVEAYKNMNRFLSAYLEHVKFYLIKRKRKCGHGYQSINKKKFLTYRH